MSAARGTINEIAKLFKSYIRSVAKSNGSSASLSDPFLCLHIQCPKGSYDANIEPLKDDVLFEDPQIVLSLAESLFKHVYGEIDSSSNDAGKAAVDKIQESNGPMARRLTAISSSQGQDSERTSSQATPTRFHASVAPPSLNTQRAGIYVSQLQEAEGASQDSVTHRDLEAVNPWSIAKMNVSVRSLHDTHRNNDASSQLLTPTRGQESYGAREESMQTSRRFSGSSTLPSPSNSDFTSTSPDARRSLLSIQPSQASPPSSAPSFLARSARDRARDRERYGNGALDTWFLKTTQPSLSRQSVEDLAVQDYEEPLSGQRVVERFGAKSQPDITTNAVRGQSSLFQPFKSPLDPTRTARQAQQNLTSSQDMGDYPSPEPEERRQEFPVMERWSSLLHHSSSTQETSSALEEALDFERRKKAAIQARRLQIKNRLESLTQGSDYTPSSSPHQNRYLAARAALASSNANANADTKTPTASTQAGTPRLDPDDPRAYFMRHRELDQQTEKAGGSKIRRLHSSKLPLERIPEGSHLYDLGLPCPIALESLSKSFRQGWETDSYIQSGTGSDAFSSSTDMESTAKLWEARLSALIREKYRAVDGDAEPELYLDLFSIIKSHVEESSQD